MRHDFHELIKVRPLTGGGWAKIKPVRVTAESEDLPNREAMTPRVGGWNLKERHDRWAVLDRYLRSQVGRLWDDVFCDICAVNDLRVKTQADVREELKWRVHQNIRLIDGVPHDTRGDRLLWRDFWVHPATGILMEIPKAKRHRWRGYRKNFNQVPIDDTQRYVQINNIWYLVTFAEFVKTDFDAFVAAARKAFRPVIYDVCFREDISWGYDNARDSLAREWGAVVYAKSKRQLGSREVKKVAAQWASIELAREAA